VMVFAPLTGGSFNPARWFGPALIGDALDASDLLVFVLGPIIGAALAVAVYRFVIAGPQYALGPEPPSSAGETVENVAADVTTRARSVEDTRDRRD